MLKTKRGAASTIYNDSDLLRPGSNRGIPFPGEDTLPTELAWPVGGIENFASE